MDGEDNGDRASSRASTPGQLKASKNGDDSDNPPESSFVAESTTRSSKPKSRRSQGASAAGVGGALQVGKIRHLKKEDGEPLWRKDIQYDFLRAVFDNEKKVFTNSYDLHQAEKQNFADLYIDTMARSSKTSKVLRDKLLSDREAAKSMAMVCLLVNVGRMNTTLNFFPEMRAQLRTYHAIPSLQAYQDASAYKQLQDAPRLKSILKGAAEDREEPHSLNDFKNMDPPRTNPVNLIFLICTQALQVAELHFPDDLEFHDLIMKTQYNSVSRANAFLWLMWMYLESDFTEEGCEENPFGAGVDYGTDVANQGVPRLIDMTPEEEALENVDPQEEIDFGMEKQSHRAKIIAADAAYLQDHQTKARVQRGKLLAEESPSAAILPRIRPSKHESDIDSTRSTPPPRALGRLGASSTGGRRGGALKYQIFDASSPAGPSSMSIDGIVPRKPRPPTAHQLAVERNRNERVEHILGRDLRKEHHKSRKARRQEGGIIRAQQRLEAMTDPFVDSDDEEFRLPLEKNVGSFRGKGFGGLVQLTSEEDDFGEEFASYAASLRRVQRRLKRWGEAGGSEVVRPVRKSRPMSTDGNKNGSRRSPGSPYLADGDKGRANGNMNGDVVMEDADDLDDMEKELLGIASGGEGEGDNDNDQDDGKDEDGDEELDDVDKTLLGMDDSDASD
ncbi:hypothetical protein BX600DRAFT_436871 [Xylariales sp. PMI_506]|nr:hypothetical protein BX600DRAFT_436871 [Xylariales sp. PMI_506]